MTKITGSSFDMYDKSERLAECRNCVEGVIDSNEVGMLEIMFTITLQPDCSIL